MKTPRARLAVFASGGGSNLQAIYDDLLARGAGAAAELALVVSDRAESGAVRRAASWGVPTLHLPVSRGDELDAELKKAEITLIALAGYLRLVPTAVTEAFRGRILNVHPALLPAFGGPGMYGRRVHEAVLASGAAVTGATVHFVDARYDEGAILAQWPVPVRADDTPDSLASRVLAVEHHIFPWCVQAVASGSAGLDEKGRVRGAPAFDFELFAPEPRRHPFGK